MAGWCCLLGLGDLRDHGFGRQHEAGVIDPTKVTRTALQNAASIAGLMLTTEAMVSEIPEPKQAAPAGHGGGMGDMY